MLLDGLRRLGLSVEEAPELHPQTFMDGVWLDKGTLFVHSSAHPGNILHEAGHLATVPRRLFPFLEPRDFIGKAMQQAITECLDLPECQMEPDHPLVHAILQMSDPEATAWSYAAAVELGVDPTSPFMRPELPANQQPYDGEGEMIYEMVRCGRYAGIHGLQAAGMCRVREWPKMRKWVQDA